MTRVLFVDDEPRILSGLERALRSKRSDWEMVFLSDAPTALEAFGEEHFDVVVTDMRMPVMDGATLLRLVRQSYPQCVRILLSGHAERTSAVRAAAVAHQLLSKPLQTQDLIQLVDRACALRSQLGHSDIRRVLGELDSLPTVPALYTRLAELLAREEPGVDVVADIISKDVGMYAKVIQLANSPMFGLRRSVSTVKEAVALLGITFISRLVLSNEVFHAFGGGSAQMNSKISALQSHSLLVADIAAHLAGGRAEAEDLYLAGMLHDVGLLALMDRMPVEFERACALARTTDVSITDAELETLGVQHAQVGAYLLSLWNLPEAVVEAVAFHHEPTMTDAEVPTLLLHVSDALAHEVAPEWSVGGAPPRLATEALTVRGLNDQLEQWRALAEDLYHLHKTQPLATP